MRRSIIAASALLTLLLASAVPAVSFERVEAASAPTTGRIAVLFDGELQPVDVAAFETKYGVLAVRPILDAELIGFDVPVDVDSVLQRILRDSSVISASENSYSSREQQSPAISSATSTVSATPGCVVPNGTQAVSLTVTARDASNAVISGATVTLAQSPTGAGAVISPVSATTNASGVATFSVTSTVNSATPVTFTATVNSVVLSADTVQVTFSNTCSSTVPTTVTLSSPTCIVPNGTAQTATFAVTAAGNVAVNNATIGSFQITGSNSPAMTVGTVETSTGTDNTFTAQLTAPSGSTGSRSFSVIVTPSGGAATTLTGSVPVCTGTGSTNTSGTTGGVVNDPMFEDQWWLSNTGQDVFIGLARLIVKATGATQILNYFPATAGNDIRWLPVRTLNVCSGAPCTGKGVTVAIIDSGVDASHPELQGQVTASSRSFDPNSATVDDTEGHGTFIAGIIAAKSNNGHGIAGIASDARLMVLKDDLSSYSQALAIRYAAEQGAQVINISSTGPANAVVQSAIDYATAPPFNTIIVASAGNSAMKGNPILYPASFPRVVSVASVDPDGTRSLFSEANSFVDISAPGGFILSLQAINAIAQTNCGQRGTPYQSPPLSSSIVYQGNYDCIFTDGQQNGSYYTSNSGTSFSAPMISAAAALAKQKWPGLTAERFEALLQSTADLAPGQTAPDAMYGAGTLNLNRLLAFNYPPEMSQGSVGLTVPIVTNSGSDTTQVIARVTDMEGQPDIQGVSVDTGSLGWGVLAMTAADVGVFTSTGITITASLNPGEYPLTVTARDTAGGTAVGVTTLRVAPAGQLPVHSITGAAPDLAVSISKPSTRKSRRIATSKKTLAMSGSAGNDVAFVEINGELAELNGSAKTWGARVKLKQGANKVRVTSYDVTRTLSDEKTIVVTLENGESSARSGTAFSDVPNGHFAEGAIARLHQLSIVSGEGGQFRPDKPVSRAEFAKMLVGAMRTGVGGHAALEDVPPGHPLERFIATVVDKGWATGQGRRFRPDMPISRIEAATMIARAKKLSGSKAQFTDISDPLQHQFASAVADAGIANGQGGRFEPSRALSRAEAAKMLAMIL